MTKLAAYGIRGMAFNLIKSYLENRKQLVKHAETTSPLANIECGVPQGSI